MSKWAVIINSMTYTSFFYYALLAVVILLYYIVPGRIKWTVLLAGSMVFYWFLVKSPVMMGAFLAMILISYVFGILIRKTGSKAVLTAGIILSAAPLALSKALEITATSILHAERGGIVLPVGASFFTLQMIAYLVDVYKKEIKAQRNLLKYALYISFFPHIIQGPIPRYDQLAKQLYTPHKFCEQNIVEGFYMILWGFFLKYMMRDFGNKARMRALYMYVREHWDYSPMKLFRAGLMPASQVKKHLYYVLPPLLGWWYLYLKIWKNSRK